jgi:hypothetical protein
MISIVDSIHLVEDNIQWKANVDMVMNLQVS